jgi:hypothetical protein
MTEETQEPEVQTEPEQATEQAPVQPPEPVFTQAEVNNIVAREVSKAKRTAKKAQPIKPQEPTTSVGDSSEAIQALSEKFQTLAEMVTAQVTDKEFETKTAGLSMDSDDRATLKLSFQNDPELFSRQVAKMKAKDLPPAPKGEEGFKGIGAPNPIAAQDRETDPNNWDADTVARYRAEGTFLKRIADHKATLPGGSGGLFKPKSRKG